MTRKAILKSSLTLKIKIFRKLALKTLRLQIRKQIRTFSLEPFRMVIRISSKEIIRLMLRRALKRMKKLMIRRALKKMIMLMIKKVWKKMIKQFQMRRKETHKVICKANFKSILMKIPRIRKSM